MVGGSTELTSERGEIYLRNFSDSQGTNCNEKKKKTLTENKPRQKNQKPSSLWKLRKDEFTWVIMCLQLTIFG